MIKYNLLIGKILYLLIINLMFIIEKTDHTNTIISLSKVSYSLKSEIKETVGRIAKEKNIQSNI